MARGRGGVVRWLLTLALLLGSVPSWAQGEGERAATPPQESAAARGFGLGAAATIGGLSGVEFAYWGERAGFSSLFQASYQDPDGGIGVTLAQVSIGGFVNVYARTLTRVAVGGRMGIVWLRLGDPEDESFHQVNLELPMRAEVFLARHFSIHLEGGLLVEILGEAGDLANGGTFGSRGEGSYVTLGGVNLLGSAGFTVYF